MIECECPKHGTFYISLPKGTKIYMYHLHKHINCPICVNKCRVVRIDPNGD